jgi:hypothetical protein
VPPMQAVHTDDPSVEEYVPSEQARQISAVVPERVVEKVPLEQREQLLEAWVLEYDPAGHPSQLELAVAPEAAENVPCVQARQVSSRVAPEAALYLPGEHGVQLVLDEAPDCVPYVPAIQRAHSDSGEAYVPAGHVKHPESLYICPGEQDIQAVVEPSEKVDAGHTKHAVLVPSTK